MATKKAVAKKQETAITVESEAPAYLQEMEQEGGVRNEDNFDSSDVTVPRIKLLQAVSSECETFDNAKAGLWWHTGLDQPLTSEVQFVICSRKKKYLLMAPLEDGQGILARAEDFHTWDRKGSWEIQLPKIPKKVIWAIEDLDVMKSGLAEWGTSYPDDPNSPPAATLFYEYLVLLPDHLDWGPAVLSITRSAIRKAKKGLNDKIRIHEGVGRPVQSLVFTAQSVNDTNSANQDFKNVQFLGSGFASQGLFAKAKEYSTLLKEYKVQDEENADEEGQIKVADSDKY